jgi:3-oxoacyl-[acyl-carrier-protein] synthase-3
MRRTRIIGTGMAVPECVVDNDLLARCLTTSDEWITQRTGIKERRVSPDTYRMLLRLADAPDKEGFIRELYDQGLDGKIDSTLMVADLALEASRQALKNAGLAPEDLDLIVDATTFGDYAYPGTAAVLAAKLGLTTTPTIAMNQGCAGSVYALATADQFIRSGMYSRALVVGAELLSPYFEFSDRGRDMCVLFADGAGAAVVEAVEGADPPGLISHHLHTDGSVLDKLYGEMFGTSTFPPASKKKIDDDRVRPRMNGRVVFVQAVRRFKEVIVECLKANGLKIDDIDLFLFHQANMRIIEAIADQLSIPLEKSFNNIAKYGNTSAASVPICLHEAVEAGRLRRGDLVMMAAFGTGFSWGATLMRW